MISCGDIEAAENLLRRSAGNIWEYCWSHVQGLTPDTLRWFFYSPIAGIPKAEDNMSGSDFDPVIFTKGRTNSRTPCALCWQVSQSVSTILQSPLSKWFNIKAPNKHVHTVCQKLQLLWTGGRDGSPCKRLLRCLGKQKVPPIRGGPDFRFKEISRRKTLETEEVRQSSQPALVPRGVFKKTFPHYNLSLSIAKCHILDSDVYFMTVVVLAK